MSAPRKITAWGTGRKLSLLGGSPDFQHTYHHDDVVRELVDASQALLDEKDDYMRRNNLGDPMKETVSARVRAALAKIAQEG